MYIIKCETASPGWMHETSAQGWCNGKTQRDGMGREVGGGFRMGNTCKSMADSWILNHGFVESLVLPMYGKNHYNIVK